MKHLLALLAAATLASGCASPGSLRSTSRTPASAPTCTMEISGRTLDLNRATEHSEEIFALIAQTEMGRPLAEEAKRRVLAHELQFAEMTADVARANSVLGIAPLALYNPENKTVYVDTRTELGILARLLAHELTHVVDRDDVASHADALLFATRNLTRIQAIRRQAMRRHHLHDSRALLPRHLRPSESREIAKLEHEMRALDSVRSFKSERKAYDAEAKFIRQLSQSLGCYGDYMAAHILDRSANPIELSDDQLIANYMLDSEAVVAYLESVGGSNPVSTGGVTSPAADSSLPAYPPHAIGEIAGLKLKRFAPRPGHPGFQISVPDSSPLRWQSYPVPYADGHEIVYFQREEDMPERASVTLIPGATTAEAVAAQVVQQIGESYQNVSGLTNTQVQFHGLSANLIRFTGEQGNVASANSRMTSEAVIFVKNGWTFLISVRSEENRFEARQETLRKISDSFSTLWR